MAAQNAKFGAGHASAWMRQGLRELRAMFFPESNVAQPTEYGMFGTQTPGEVANGRQVDSQAQRMDQEPAAPNMPHRSPSDIAAEAKSDKQQSSDRWADHATAQQASHRSPSDIAADRSAPSEQQQQQRHHDQGYSL